MTEQMGRTAEPEVAVTLVLYNSRDHLANCLAAIRPDVASGQATLIAVDNASPDDSAAIVASAVPHATVIRSPRNLGFAGGCALAWRQVTTRYWLLLNPDAILDSGAIEELRRWMDQHQDVGIVSPWFRESPGAPVSYPGRGFPSIWRTLLETLRLHRLLPQHLRGVLLRGSYVDPGRGTKAQMAADWVPGTVVMARAEAVREVGPPDQAFFLYGEDLEWCWRMRAGGWRIGTCPSAAATHHLSASSRRTFSEPVVEERVASGVLQACRQMRGRAYARGYGIVTLLGLVIEAWHPRRPELVKERYRSVARAWLHAVRSV